MADTLMAMRLQGDGLQSQLSIGDMWLISGVHVYGSHVMVVS